MGFYQVSLFILYSESNWTVENTFVWISSKNSASKNFKVILKVLIPFLDGGCKIIST